MSTLSPSGRIGVVLAGLAATLGSVSSFGGSAGILLRPHEPSPFPSPRYRGSYKIPRRAGQRKLLRTTRAMTSQGVNLKAHFDSHRLTRSQLKKFYAGKGIAAY